MGFSKLHESCEKCKHKDNCDNKRMVACGVMALTSPSKIVKPHISINLVDIQIGTSLEENINKQLKKELGKRVLCGFGFDELRGLK
jgi:quinolinate synthase